MILARRIRGDRHFDFVDREAKDGSEIYIQLPYRNKKEGMKELGETVR